MNNAKPEASIMLSLRAFQLTMTYLQRNASMILCEDGVTEVSLYHAVASFDRATNDMLMPGYLDEEQCTGVTLTNGHPWKRIIPLPNVQVKNELKGVLVELHMFYLRYPSKCKQCDCDVEECAYADYRQLWEQYVRSMGTSFRGRLTRAQISTLLPGWRMWAARQGLVGKQLQICDGPVSLRNPMVQMFDRAQPGFVQLAGSNQEGHAKAKNSIFVISHHTKRGSGMWAVFAASLQPLPLVMSTGQMMLNIRLRLLM